MSTDRFTVRAVVLLLGAFALLGLAGLIWLIGGVKTAVDASALAIVAGLTGTALGALGTLLASTKSGDGDAVPVAVVNADTDPVPVDPDPKVGPVRRR